MPPNKVTSRSAPRRRTPRTAILGRVFDIGVPSSSRGSPGASRRPTMWVSNALRVQLERDVLLSVANPRDTRSALSPLGVSERLRARRTGRQVPVQGFGALTVDDADASV